MTKYLNFFESESGFTEAVEAGQLFYPNVSYTEDDDTVHWNLTQPANPVETPMLRMSFSTSSPGQEVGLGNCFTGLVTAMEIDGTPVNYTSGGTYSVASPGNHTAVYQFASPEIPGHLFWSDSGAFDTFTSAEIISPVTEIGNGAFIKCRGLTSVTIPDSVTTISVQAFAGSGLRSVTVPDSVTTLSGYPFFHCTEMRSATIGSGVTAIPYQAFAECTSLQSVVLPGNLTAIGQEAFRDCSSLYDINIPSGVTTIDGKAFSGCTGLTAIYLNPETPPTLGTDALDNTNNCPIYVPAASVETYQQAWPAYASRIRPMGGGQYNITAEVNDDSLGQVILGQETATEGETVGFSVNVFDPVSSEVMAIQIRDENVNEVQYTDEGDGNYSFTMPASDVNVSAYIVETGRHRITVNVNDETLGEVSIGQDSASEGEQVSFSVDVYDSEQNQISSVTVTDGNGNEVQVTEDWDNHYSFDMPGSDVTISVVIGEKPKYTVTVDSTDGFAENINFLSGDGEASYREGENVAFSFSLIDSERLQVVSAQASDCGGGSIEVTVEGDSGDYFCHFTMPGCDSSVFITIEEKQ